MRAQMRGRVHPLRDHETLRLQQVLMFLSFFAITLYFDMECVYVCVQVARQNNNFKYVVTQFIYRFYCH